MMQKTTGEGADQASPAERGRRNDSNHDIISMLRWRGRISTEDSLLTEARGLNSRLGGLSTYRLSSSETGIPNLGNPPVASRIALQMQGLSDHQRIIDPSLLAALRAGIVTADPSFSMLPSAASQLQHIRNPATNQLAWNQLREQNVLRWNEALLISKLTGRPADHSYLLQGFIGGQGDGHHRARSLQAAAQGLPTVVGTPHWSHDASSRIGRGGLFDLAIPPQLQDARFPMRTSLEQGLLQEEAYNSSARSTDKSTSRTLEPFPEKLHRLFMETEAEGHDSIISFTEDGMAFKIHKPDAFFTKIIPKYFKISHLSSFKRQLNLYGFEMVTFGPTKGAYFHKYFQKKHPELCTFLRRRDVKLGSRPSPQFLRLPPFEFYSMPPYSMPSITPTRHQSMRTSFARPDDAKPPPGPK